MKKKIALLISIVLAVSVLSFTAVFAQSSDGTNNNNFFKSMFDNMKNWVKQSEDKGQITKQQADNWDQHINDMQKYHEKSGNVPCGGGHTGNGNDGNAGNNGNSDSNGNAGSTQNGDNQTYTPRYGGSMMGGFSNAAGSGYGMMRAL